MMMVVLLTVSYSLLSCPRLRPAAVNTCSNSTGILSGTSMATPTVSSVHTCDTFYTVVS